MQCNVSDAKQEEYERISSTLGTSMNAYVIRTIARNTPNFHTAFKMYVCVLYNIKFLNVGYYSFLMT